MNSSAESCPDCGAAISGGRDGCQALFDELTARAYADVAYASVRDLAFDTYCMQHLETYCHSAKSYAAHLTRLCCGIDYSGDPRVYEAIQHWLNGSVKIEKPQVLNQVGTMTVMDVRDAFSAAEHIRRVRAWAANVWELIDLSMILRTIGSRRRSLSNGVHYQNGVDAVQGEHESRTAG